jgi:DNA-binding transcriptional LysR family regulator
MDFMRLRHIEVFNAVMLTGSVSGAARLVNVTQPAVSRTLQHAEVQLGFALFQRVKNRLVPTTEALTLYPHVERLFANLDEVQRLADTLKSGRDAKEVRVVSILTLGHEVLPRAVKLFAAKLPKVGVTIKTLHSPQMVSSLVLQEADVGFFYSPAAHPALQMEALGETQMMCVAPKGMLAAKTLRGGAVSLEELVPLPVIGLDTTHPLGITLSQACREAGVGLSSTINVQTYHAALSLARHGLGIALVDGCTALSADPALVDVLPLRPSIPVSIQAACPAGKPTSVVVRAFIRAVQQVLAEALTQPQISSSPAAPSRKRG